MRSVQLKPLSQIYFLLVLKYTSAICNPNRGRKMVDFPKTSTSMSKLIVAFLEDAIHCAVVCIWRKISSRNRILGHAKFRIELAYPWPLERAHSKVVFITVEAWRIVCLWCVRYICTYVQIRTTSNYWFAATAYIRKLISEACFQPALSPTLLIDLAFIPYHCFLQCDNIIHQKRWFSKTKI